MDGGILRSLFGAAAILMSVFAVSTPDLAASEESAVETILSDSGGIVPDWVRVTGGLPTGNNYFGVEFGDVNNDGMLDAATMPETGGMRVFIGNGLGTFTEQSTGLVTTGNRETNLVLADFNNDGALDIAGDGVFFGNGGRGGSMVWTQTVSPGSWYAVTAADVDLDGKMDIVAGTTSGVRVWKGNGGAGGTMVWTPAQTGLPGTNIYMGCKVGDLNHDGNPDIVCADYSNGIRAWTGNGGTAWTNAYTGSGLPTTDSYMGIDLGDVNHDGNLDILSSGYYSAVGVRIWLGDGGAGGSMNFVEASSGLPFPLDDRWTNAIFAELNDDGNLDIVGAHYAGNGLEAWLGDGGAGGTVDWTTASATLPSDNYINADAGDFNNDGKTDILAGFSNGVDVWRNERPDFNINSYQSASVNLPTTDTWADVQLADVNNDGKQDIGFTSFQDQDKGLRVFLGNGQGIWTNSSAGLPVTGSFSGMRFADINHDGTLDIVVAGEGGASSAGVHVYRGDGLGSWTEVGQVTTRSGAGLELTDVNDDGDLDVLTGYWTNAWGPMVFLGNGNFGWGANVGPVSTMNVDDVAAADVNHDGKIDIAASSMNGIGIQLWTGDGSGTIAGWQRNDTGLPTAGVYLGLTFADVDHDGNPDLAAAGYAGVGQGLYVWLGNGGAGGSMVWIPASTGLPGTGQYGGAEFGDTDVDSDQDLIAADSRNAGATGIVYRRGNGGAGGTTSWSSPIIAGIPSSGKYWGVAFGNVDNDGIPDIAVAGTAGVQVYKQGAPPNRPPTIAITQPVGGEDWTGGTVHNIDWNANDMEDPVASLKVWLNYSVTGGPPYNRQVMGLQGVPASSRPYAWTVALENSASVVLNATIIDTAGARGYDDSPAFAIDSTAPTVISTNPFSGETGVPTSANVQATWSEPMMRTSVESAFSLKDTATWTPVAGTLSWAGNTLTFSPTGVLASGTQYSANFTTSARDPSDPGNNLAAPYSWTFTTAAFVDVERPTLTSATALPDPQEVYFPVNVSAVVRDNVAVGQVWLNVTNPATSTLNSTMSYDPFGMRYFLERNCGMLGLHTFVIWASDTSGLWNSTSGQFTCEDTTRPSISDLRAVPNPVEVFASTNLSALVSDNYLLSEVWVEVTAPDLTRTNVSMIAGPRYSRETIPDQLGDCIFRVSARDSVGLWAAAVNLFQVEDNTRPLIVNLVATPSPVALFAQTNITADVTDNYLLAGVWVEVTAPDLTLTNQSMAGGPAFYFEYTASQVGAYPYRVSAVDSSGNWQTDSGIFQTTESVPPSIEHTPRATWPVTVALNITANVTDNILVQEVKLDYTDVDGVRRNVSMAVVTADEYSYEVVGQPHAGSISYYIWAVDGSLNAVRSQTYTTSIIERVPNPPAGLTVVPEGFGALRLSWAAPSLNTDSSPLTDLRGYNVYRMTQPNGQRTKVNGPLVTGTTFLDDNVGLGLADGTIYYYNVTAVNSRGIESAPAQEDGTTLSRSSGTDTSVILIAVAIIIVIIMAVILLLMKRRKRKESEQQQELAERKAPPPPPDDG
jgi:hypothetical protein